jgi:hypothetical protein
MFGFKIPKVAILFISLWSLLSCSDREVKRTYYATGELESETETMDGFVKHGFGRSYYIDGTVKYQGKYEDNLRVGWHILHYPDGQIHRKTFYTVADGMELARRKMRYTKRGDLISDYSFSKKNISIEVTNPKPYQVNDVLAVKLKIEDAKHTYSEAIFGNFDRNLNILSDSRHFSAEVAGDENHEIFMKIQVIKPGRDTLKWLIRDFDFVYRTDTTGTSSGEEAYVELPIEVLPGV